MTRRQLLAAILIAYVIFLLDIALFRFPAPNPTPNAIPFRSMLADWRSGGSRFVINFLGNIIAFLPMGLLPPLIRRRPTYLWHVIFLSAGDQPDDRSGPARLGSPRSRRRRPDPQHAGRNTGIPGASHLAATQWCNRLESAMSRGTKRATARHRRLVPTSSR